jgi:hypothetical protein
VSGLVFTLPPIEPTVIPQLRGANPSSTFCLQQPSLVFPVERSPLAYVTELVYDPVLRIKSKAGGSMDVPITQIPHA